MTVATKLIGEPILNIPWMEKPEGCRDIMWRYEGNPIIEKDAVPSANSIFNSAVVPFNGGFAGVFRCDDRTRTQRLHTGFSPDGIAWSIQADPIRFECGIPEIAEFILGYDPRVCFIEDRYYLTWCNAYHNAPTIGVAYTYDFQTYHQIENAFLPFNRNGVLFPRKINGKFVMLSRPSDNGHTPFGDIYYSSSPDMIHWGCHRHVMEPMPRSQWQSTKIGAGPIPIETSEGWLLFYHGVLSSCNGFVYSCGAALLDLDEPWRVKCRSKEYLMAPMEQYERVGDVPNVVFPCAALADAATGRIAVYYGAADTSVALAFVEADEMLSFLHGGR
ncbi:MAG: glycosidase [Paenibacillaceae bacterium]|nr:glycosidase [Paenibacillaceae bacterium]